VLQWLQQFFVPTPYAAAAVADVELVAAGVASFSSMSPVSSSLSPVVLPCCLLAAATVLLLLSRPILLSYLTSVSSLSFIAENVAKIIL